MNAHSLQQHPESWGRTSMTGNRKEMGQEADKNIKEHYRDEVPAVCTQDFCKKSSHEPLGVPHLRISPPGLQAPSMSSC